MRHLKIATLLSASALAAAVALPGAAHAATPRPQATTTHTCYPNTSRAYDYTSYAIVDKQRTTTLADGTKLPAGYVAQSDPPYYPTKTSGYLLDGFTNQTTQKTIKRVDDATGWFTYDPAPTVPGALATGTYISTGANAESFGPKSQAAFEAAGVHEPTLVFVRGLLVMHFVVDADGSYVTTFSLDGSQQNGCALLAHGS